MRRRSGRRFRHDRARSIHAVGVNRAIQAIPALVLGMTLSALFPTGARAEYTHWSPPNQTADRPDDGFIDSNGDGIDGMRLGPIFVAPTGDDRNPGTIEAPMRSIGAGILAARTRSPIRDVYVSSSGTYPGTVVFLSGVNVYGGYNHAAGWTRSEARATIEGGVIGAWAQNISVPTTLDRLYIRAADNPVASGHSIGLVVRDNSAPLTLNHCLVRGGIAGRGQDGQRGQDGGNGSGGQGGSEGSCDGNGSGAAGGAGGAGANPGGAGGRGGPSSGSGNGSSGSRGGGTFGGNGGAGGAGGNPGKAGGDAGAGGSGAHGAHGGGGQGLYANGFDGGWGTDGAGGGGGGGGGGQVCTFCDNGQGHGGGGGGGGGYRGAPGTGGRYGGSSYGILNAGTVLNLYNTEVEAGTGGAGGNGGLGGYGGSGGTGGGWYYTCNNEIGRGGWGGRGGNGGNGGNGGGGRGGSAIAVFWERGGALNGPGSTFRPGTPGPGGSVPQGNAGAPGMAAEVYYSDGVTPLPLVNPPTAAYGAIVIPANAGTTYVTPLIADPEPSQSYNILPLEAPANGTAGVTETGVWYAPRPGFWGYDSFRFRIMDPSSNGAVDGSVIVNVTQPPFSVADAARALRLAGGMGSFEAADTRLDLEGGPSAGVVNLADVVRLARKAAGLDPNP